MDEFGRTKQIVLDGEKYRLTAKGLEYLEELSKKEQAV